LDALGLRPDGDLVEIAESQGLASSVEYWPDLPPPDPVADVHLCVAAPHGPTAAGEMLAAA
jgi:hypothetical protein